MDRVLIIEDDLHVLDNISEILILEDFEVFTASNGRDGVNIAFKEFPDIIICDVMMPEMDGYEVLKEIRKSPVTFDTPFIFLTAKTHKSDQRIGMDLGADDYITKPYRNHDIINAINTRLEKKKTLQSFNDDKMEELRNSIALALPHELRTPLNGIFGFVQLLRNDFKSFSDEEIQLMLDNIYDASQRLYRLILNYLFYARLLETNVNKLKPGEFITKYPEMAIYNQAKITANNYDRFQDLSLDLSNTPIMVSESKFIKLAEELIDNAFKFSETETKVTLKAEISDGFYIFSVHNFGRGMESDQINKIGAYMQFEREKFEQQGLGLGLAIAKKVTELFNGRFDIDSIPDKYFKISVALPVWNEQI